MATHWTEKRRAKANLAEALAPLGWTVYGYSGDKSDMQTDYYDPASWHGGVAQKGPFVLVVGANPNDSGRPITEVRIEDGPCSPCNGKGTHAAMSGGDPYVPKDTPCSYCKGTGRRTEHREFPTDLRWPEFRPNTARTLWHVQLAAGRILASGSKLWHVGRDSEAMKALVDEIERVARMDPDAMPETAASPAGWRIAPSTVREGYTEIFFDEKPSQEARTALKAHGYRWAPSKNAWYGRTDALPPIYQQELVNAG